MVSKFDKRPLSTYLAKSSKSSLGEGHFGFDHPELCGVPRRVGVFSAESGSEGIDIAQGASEQLGFELTGDREARLPAEEVPGKQGLPLGRRRRGERQGGHPKHFTGALAVRTGENGTVQAEEPPLPEETVHGEGGLRADPEKRAVLVGARPQVGDGAQKLVGVALLLQRVGLRVGGSHHPQRGGPDLPGLPCAGGSH